jgi:hypothetical protein
VAFREWDGPTAMLFLVGLMPLVGLAVLGRWPQWELGAGAAVSLFALRQLLGPGSPSPRTSRRRPGPPPTAR